MNVGDYVRTRDGFDRLVDKRKDDNHNYYWYRFGNGKTMTNPENGFVIKSSPNIIDLIEVGDYINGHKVLKTNLKLEWWSDDDQEMYDEYQGILLEEYGLMYPNSDTDYGKISIVTKEQFSNMEYIVESY